MGQARSISSGLGRSVEGHSYRLSLQICNKCCCILCVSVLCRFIEIGGAGMILSRKARRARFRKLLRAWFNLIFGLIAALISVYAFTVTLTDPESPLLLYVLGLAVGLGFAYYGRSTLKSMKKKRSSVTSKTENNGAEPMQNE